MARLNQASVFECTESALLLDCAYAAGGYSERYGLLQFRDINFLFLEIWIATNSATRIELCSTSAVGISTAIYRSSLGYVADSCHKRCVGTMLSYCMYLARVALS